MSGRYPYHNPEDRLSHQVGTTVTESQYLVIKSFMDINDVSLAELLRDSLKSYLKSEGVDL